MILVTGAYGFIGSNFVKFLNSKGKTDIIVSDYLTNGRQFKNLDDCEFSLFLTPRQVLEKFNFLNIEKVFHFGAISNTTEWNGDLMMEKNYAYTTELFDLARIANVDFSYSSSASVYGNGDGPLNLYAYSKKLIEEYVSNKIKKGRVFCKVQGFRYFNVYGNIEDHKGDQASPYHKFKMQAINDGVIKIFKGSECFKRDFVPVDKVCEVQYMMMQKGPSGIYDLGSGTQKSFYDVAIEISKIYPAVIEEIDFPDHLKNTYQVNTLANMDYLARFCPN